MSACSRLDQVDVPARSHHCHLFGVRLWEYRGSQKQHCLMKLHSRWALGFFWARLPAPNWPQTHEACSWCEINCYQAFLVSKFWMSWTGGVGPARQSLAWDWGSDSVLRAIASISSRWNSTSSCCVLQLWISAHLICCCALTCQFSLWIGIGRCRHRSCLRSPRRT